MCSRMLRHVSPRQAVVRIMLLALVVLARTTAANDFSGSVNCTTVLYSEKFQTGSSFGFSTGVVLWRGQPLYYNIRDFAKLTDVVGFNIEESPPRSLMFECIIYQVEEGDPGPMMRNITLRLFSLPLGKDEGGTATDYKADWCQEREDVGGLYCFSLYDELPGQDRTASALAILLNLDEYTPSKGPDMVSGNQEEGAPPAILMLMPPSYGGSIFAEPPASTKMDDIGDVTYYPTTPPPASSSSVLHPPPPPYEDPLDDVVFYPTTPPPASGFVVPSPVDFAVPPFQIILPSPTPVPDPAPAPSPGSSPGPSQDPAPQPKDCPPCRMPMDAFTTSISRRPNSNPSAFYGSVQDFTNRCNQEMSGYNFRECNAFNMWAPAGTAVYATEDGMVLSDDFRCLDDYPVSENDYGCYLTISATCSGRIVHYSRLAQSSLTVSPGSAVTRGQVIGQLANPSRIASRLQFAIDNTAEPSDLCPGGAASMKPFIPCPSSPCEYLQGCIFESGQPCDANAAPCDALSRCY